jgi:hypothetical protein
VPKQAGIYPAEPVYYEGGIFILSVNFLQSLIQIIRFDCEGKEIKTIEELPLSCVKDCYNLHLDIAPVTLTRQCVGSNEFEIIWPERVRFEMGDHDSFFLRDGDRLYFNRWHEDEDGSNYYDETVVTDLQGKTIEVLPGDIRIMPNGETWFLK